MEASLQLRQWKDSDLAPFARMNADPEVMKHFPRPLTEEESLASLRRQQRQIEDEGWGLWAVEVDGEFAGFTGLARPRFEAAFTPCVEIGWRFRREFWGRSIAFEAARQAETFAFQRLGLPELVCFTAKVNERSWRLMRRLGFTEDPSGAFFHPNIEKQSPLAWHVLYRKRKPLI